MIVDILIALFIWYGTPILLAFIFAIFMNETINDIDPNFFQYGLISGIFLIWIYLIEIGVVEKIWDFILSLQDKFMEKYK